MHGGCMTTNERIAEQSFCYDPDFPPDVAEGLPLSAASSAAPKESGEQPAPVRRTLRSAATALAKRARS
jgi:hypothetical protein